MTRSKLSSKVMLLVGGIGLLIAAFAGSQPAAAQDYSCPAGYVYDPDYGCTTPGSVYDYDYGGGYLPYGGYYGLHRGYHGFAHGIGGGFNHDVGLAHGVGFAHAGGFHGGFGGGFHGGGFGGGHR
jgi:hypothetical protein